MELLPEEASPTRGDSELEKRARQVGTIAGTAVAMIRHARRRLEDSEGQFGDQLNDIGSKAKSKVHEFRGTASVRAEEWRRVAQERTVEIGRNAKFRLERARERVIQFGHDYPWHLVVTAGIVGFILGATLRVRRSNRGF